MSIAKLGLQFLASMLMVKAAIAANSGANPYETIPERNVFGLKEAPAAPPPAEPTEPPTKILLAGISTIMEDKLALLKVLYPASPGQPPKEDSLILKEGEQAGQISVVQIDERVPSVKVNANGATKTLTFDRDGVKEVHPPIPAPQTTPGLNVPGPMQTPGRIPVPTRIPIPSAVAPTPPPPLSVTNLNGISSPPAVQEGLTNLEPANSVNPPGSVTPVQTPAPVLYDHSIPAVNPQPFRGPPVLPNPADVPVPQ